MSVLLASLVVTAREAPAQSFFVNLEADNLFPMIGTPVQFKVSGPPDAFYVLGGSAKPAEIPVGDMGTLFLDPTALITLDSGVLPAGGTATFTLVIPSAPNLDGVFFYFQAGMALFGKVRLSQALPVRIGLDSLDGARNPVAIAATSDGTKAYVAHQKDGSISVLDPATDTKVIDLPASSPAGSFRHVPVDLAVDPEDRHLFVANAGSPFLTVFHVPTDSIVARIAVPKGCQRIAFDFTGGRKRIYVTNDRDEQVLVFEEGAPGFFTQLPSLPLEGVDPRPIAVLPNGLLMVGNRGTHELEVLDPSQADGSPTVARTSLGSLPLAIVLAGDVALVATFTPTQGPPVDGINEVLAVELQTFQVQDTILVDLGTDYLDAALASPFLAVIAAGSGTILLADADTGALLDRVNLAPGQGPGLVPNAIPQRVAFVQSSGGGSPSKVYTVNYFRETVRSVLLTSGPPFSLGAEIALAHSGVPRIPFRDLTPEEDGHWFFRSVKFFNGGPESPNPTTCFTCHPDGAADGLNTNPFGRQVQSLFRSPGTGPFGWQGQVPLLLAIIRGAFDTHGIFPGRPPAGSSLLIFAFLANEMGPPPSPFLLSDGSLSSEALAGKTLFGGKAGCASCHAEPLFIPARPLRRTIPGGVGTGLAPANVPSLRGVWNTAPYLHDGLAITLMDVLTQNPLDQHGMTSSLTSKELEQLVAYLKSL